MADVKVIDKKVTPMEGKNYVRLDFVLDAGKGEFKGVAFRSEKVFETVTAGNSYKLEIKKEEQRNGEVQYVVSPPERDGWKGKGKGGGFGRPHDPALEMVKNAAVQASQVLKSFIDSGGIPDKDAVMQIVTVDDAKFWTNAFFHAQKELYAEAVKSNPQPSQGKPQEMNGTAKKEETTPPGGEPEHIKGDEEDDLPF